MGSRCYECGEKFGRCYEHGGACACDVHKCLQTREVGAEPAAGSGGDSGAEAAVQRVTDLLNAWESAHTHLGSERPMLGPSSSAIRRALDGGK